MYKYDYRGFDPIQFMYTTESIFCNLLQIDDSSSVLYTTVHFRD